MTESLPFNVGSTVYLNPDAPLYGIVKAYSCDRKKVFLEVVEDRVKKIIQVYVSQIFPVGQGVQS